MRDLRARGWQTCHAGPCSHRSQGVSTFGPIKDQMGPLVGHIASCIASCLTWEPPRTYMPDLTLLIRLRQRQRWAKLSPVFAC